MPDRYSRIVAVVPARLACSRFPGKPLAEIHGIPMIGHCYKRAKMAKAISEVFVATCDSEIAKYINSIDGDYVMTRDIYVRPTDRAVEAVEKIENLRGYYADIVVILQGDEPMVTPPQINSTVEALEGDHVSNVVGLYTEIDTKEEYENPNTIKVLLSQDSHAIYFSRQPILPWRTEGINIPKYKQVCAVAFRREYLFTYRSLRQTPCEIVESIDLNRILEHGGKIRMIHTNLRTHSIDTPNDIGLVENLMSGDQFLAKYAVCPG